MAHRPFIRALIRGLAACALAGNAAAALADDLRIGLSADVTSMDPQWNNAGPNNAMALHVFESLVFLDKNGRYTPGLATSWKPIDANTWEIKLRPNVKWSDGTPFTGEDVKASIERPARLTNSPGPFTSYTKSITDVQIVDPLTVRLKVSIPNYASIPNDLNSLPILPKRVANASQADFDAGRAMIGTGPFLFDHFTRGQEIVLKKNPHYWGRAPQWDKVTFKIITDNAARTAALLSGDVDVVEAVPAADVPRIKQNPNFHLEQQVSWRTIFWQMDQGRDVSPFVTDKAGKPLPKNPLKDARVRQAISLAISRQAIVDRVMEGAAEPTGQLVNSALFGHVPGLKAPAADPATAKKLLAQAGYPDGFAITLHATNNRYVNDDRVAQVVAAMLSRIGIATKVETMPSATFFTRANKLDFSFLQAGWGADTGEASSSLKALLATYDPARGWGASNRGRYSNPALDAKLAEALQTIDDAKREKLLQEATEIGMRDAGVIPLYFNINVWAARKGYTVTPRLDERTYAFDVRH